MTELFLQDFAQRYPGGDKSGSWLDRLKRDGIRSFGALGLPTTKLEDWRYTSLESIRNTRYEIADVGGEGGRMETDFALRSSFYTENDLRLVFVNGHYTPELSAIAALPAGIIVGNLQEILIGNPGLVEKYLGQVSLFQDRAMVALNTALFRYGFFLSVPAGIVVEGPIYVCHLSWNNSAGRPTASHPRNLIVMGEGSSASVVEVYMGSGEEEYFTNAVTEGSLSQGRAVDDYRLQQESGKATDIASLDVHQGRDSRFSSQVISLG